MEGVRRCVTLASLSEVAASVGVVVVVVDAVITVEGISKQSRFENGVSGGGTSLVVSVYKSAVVGGMEETPRTIR